MVIYCVLGATYRNITVSNLDSIIKNGVYGIRNIGAVSNIPTDINTSTAAILVVGGNHVNNNTQQILVLTENSGGIWTRNAEGDSPSELTWGTWKRCDSFGYATLSDLANALGGLGMVREYFVQDVNYDDFDNYTGHGFFSIQEANTKAHAPSANSIHGFLMNFAWESARSLQVFFEGYPSVAIYARRYGGEGWGSWHTVSMT